MCNTACEIEAATQPLSHSGRAAGPATLAERLDQPLLPERLRGWVAEWLHQATVAECLSGWIASAA